MSARPAIPPRAADGYASNSGGSSDSEGESPAASRGAAPPPPAPTSASRRDGGGVGSGGKRGPRGPPPSRRAPTRPPSSSLAPPPETAAATAAAEEEEEKEKGDGAADSVSSGGDGEGASGPAKNIMVAPDGTELPPGYNMSWFCVHSLMPIPGGCKICGIPAPGPAGGGSSTKPKPPKPGKPARPNAAPARPAAVVRPPRPKPATATITATDEGEGQGAEEKDSPAAAATAKVNKPAKPARPGPPSPHGSPKPPRPGPPSPRGSPKPPRPSRPTSMVDGGGGGGGGIAGGGGSTAPKPSNKPPPPRPASRVVEASKAGAEPGLEAEETEPPKPAHKPTAIQPPRPKPKSAKGSSERAKVDAAADGTAEINTAAKEGETVVKGVVGEVSANSTTRAAPTKPSRPKPAPTPAPSKPPRPTKATRPGARPKPARPAQKSVVVPGLPPRPTRGHPLWSYMVTGPRVQVLFAWEGQNEKELSLVAGDTVEIVRWVSPEWIEGKIDGAMGIFPAGFVDVIEDVALKGPRVCATFDFEGERDYELSFGVGEEFNLLGRIDSEWLRGSYRGLEGAFPAAFVEIIEDLPAGTTEEGWPDKWKEAPAEVTEPEASEDREGGGGDGAGEAHQHGGDASQDTGFGTIPCARALYDYEASVADDLGFQQDDVIILLERIDDAWLRGRFSDREGIFPAEFVDILVPLPASGKYDPAPAPRAAPRKNPDAMAVVDDEPTPAPAPAPRATPRKTTTAAAAAAVAPVSVPTPVPTGHGSATALYDYEASVADDLPFITGAEIVLLERIDADWMRGTYNGREGIFPANFVEVTREPSAPEPKPKQEQEPTATPPSNPGATGLAEALYDYDATEASDLPFKAGMGIVLLERLDAEWYRGSCAGKEGIFPANLVNILTPL